jgi:hypothetical protein
VAGSISGERDCDLDEQAVAIASIEMIHAAGRPEGYELVVSEYEREAWKQATRRVLRAYFEACSP